MSSMKYCSTIMHHSTLPFSYLISLLLIIAATQSLTSQALLPSANVEIYSNSNKFGPSSNKLTGSEGAAEQSFREFIHSKSPDSTVIGQIKPNASALEIMLLKNKIADTILSMQELEKQAQESQQQNSFQNQNSNGVDCYIEVTRIEKIPGKCHRVGGGLPVCQSDNHMAISRDCS